MTERRTLSGTDSSDIWQQINSDFIAGNNLHDYHVLLQYDHKQVELDIVSSPGGSYEGGYDYTKFRAPLSGNTGFLFSIHPEDFLNKVGKVFGMQDVVIGYPEFDNNVIVKTNDAERFKVVFQDSEVRQVFQTLSGYSLKIGNNDEKDTRQLELSIQRAIINGAELQKIYNAFYHVLGKLENNSNSLQGADYKTIDQ